MAVPAEVDNAVLRHLPVIPAHPDTVHDRLHITAITVTAGTVAGVVRPIIEAETIITIAVAMDITETTAIIIHARIRVGITTAMTVTDVGVEEAVGVAEEATMAEGVVAVAGVGVTTAIRIMMMTATIAIAKRINFQTIWNTFPQKMTPWLPEPCSLEILNLISLTRKLNAFLDVMGICSTLTSNVHPQGPVMLTHSFVTRI